MRSISILLGVLSLVAIPGSAIAQAAPAAPATAAAVAAPAPGRYNTADTDIGTLLDDPAAKAVLDKAIPGFSTKDQIDMARSMTLKSVQQYAPDLITDKALADIDADLAKLPAAPAK